jgi:hypothetical protein
MAGLADVRGKSDEACDGLAIALARFGQVRDQEDSDLFADPGDGAEARLEARITVVRLSRHSRLDLSSG